MTDSSVARGEPGLGRLAVGAVPAPVAAQSRAPAGGRSHADQVGRGPRARRPLRAAALPAVDLLALGLAGAATAWAGWLLPRDAGPCAAYAAGVLTALALGRMYRLRICLRVSDQAGRMLAAVTVPLLLMLPWLPADLAWRLALASALAVAAGRGLAYGALRSAHRCDLLTDPTVVIGTGELGVQIVRLLREHPELGLRPLGFVDDRRPPAELSLPVLGTLADLPEVVGRFGVRRVIVCSPPGGDQDLLAALRACRGRPADVCVVPRLPELGVAVPRACLDEIWGIPLIPLRWTAPAPLRLKRALDALAAALLLAVLGPVLLVLAAAVRLFSGPPVLFRQVRVTGEDRIAPVIKLRTLAPHDDCDTSWRVPTERSTRLGRWLRASHLDELPQLVNVLRGEMSLVGPRPERPYFTERFRHQIPDYDGRTRMPAGMTGWAQVHGLHGDTSVADRVRFDNQYIEYWSPWLDAVILARTFATTVTGILRSRS